jgi:hypothetical protein
LEGLGTENVDIFYCHLVIFLVICYILHPFLVHYCTKKNLATLNCWTRGRRVRNLTPAAFASVMACDIKYFESFFCVLTPMTLKTKILDFEYHCFCLYFDTNYIKKHAEGHSKLHSKLHHWPPGVNFVPIGVKLSPGGEILCLPLHSSKKWRVDEQTGEYSP